MLKYIRNGLIIFVFAVGSGSVGGMAGAALAGKAKPTVLAEIESLLTRLESSACRFNRNGSWYTAKEAKSHLQAKLDYIDERTTLANAEQFIALAASKSSLSGQPYLVQCGNGAPQPSAVWLTTQLGGIRKGEK